MDTTSDGGRPHVTFSPTTPNKVIALGSPGAVPGGQRKTPSRAGTKRLGVDGQGQYTYKKTPSSTLMASLQLGLQHSIGSIEPKPHRDILMTDFEVVETVEFPAAGSGCTPAHKYKDFTFKTYSPEAMRFFRESFQIPPEDFMLALCDRPLREVGNPGASGSLFYLSADDAFILKTVQKKEARFLQKLLPGYYLNLTQNKRTLLPKFFGLYRYKSGSVNIRIVVMNNLLPSSIHYQEKYDLKGSTYKRKANSSEVKKRSPTYKDVDFIEKHEEGIILAPEKYEALLHSVERDCKVLESFGIMDYSLLLGIHNIDQAIREKAEAAQSVGATTCEIAGDAPVRSRIELSKNFSIVSTEDIPTLLAEEQQQRHYYPEGYIQGRIHGDRVMFYLGIIDILQSYKLKKKLEHGIKSVITDGSTVSVHNPSFYARRFQDFMTTLVFKKDKTKYRSRKNSTTAQQRGGRRPAALSLGKTTSSADRQSSRDSKTSPLLHDPPSYNQAMKGSGVSSLSPTAQANIRARSSSESVTSSYRSPRAALAVQFSTPVKGAASPGIVTPKSETVSPLATKATTKRDAVDGGASYGSYDVSAAAGGDSVVVAEGTDPGAPGEVLTVHDTEQDFARHVRGTSTPIDVTPPATPTHSRSHGDGESEDGEGVGRRSSYRRSDAIDAGPEESREEGGGVCETS